MHFFVEATCLVFRICENEWNDKVKFIVHYIQQS